MRHWELDCRRQAWIQFINANERTNRKPSRFLSESGGHVSRRTCKPNSVSRRGGTTVIPLGRASLRDSSDLPGSGGASSRNARRISSPLLPYLVLLRVGFALPWLLPARRCALTAPFHPYPGKPGRYVFCGTFRRPGFSRDSQALPGTLLCGVRTFLVHLFSEDSATPLARLLRPRVWLERDSSRYPLTRQCPRPSGPVATVRYYRGFSVETLDSGSENGCRWRPDAAMFYCPAGGNWRRL